MDSYKSDTNSYYRRSLHGIIYADSIEQINDLYDEFEQDSGFDESYFDEILQSSVEDDMNTFIDKINDFQTNAPSKCSTFCPYFVDSGLAQHIVDAIGDENANYSLRIELLKLILNLGADLESDGYINALLDCELLSQINYLIKLKDNEIPYYAIIALSVYSAHSTTIRNIILNEIDLDQLHYMLQSNETSEGIAMEILRLVLWLLYDRLEEDAHINKMFSIITNIFLDYFDEYTQLMLKIANQLIQYDNFYEEFEKHMILNKFYNMYCVKDNEEEEEKKDSQVKYYQYLFPILLTCINETLLFDRPELIDTTINFLDSEMRKIGQDNQSDISVFGALALITKISEFNSGNADLYIKMTKFIIENSNTGYELKKQAAICMMNIIPRCNNNIILEEINDHEIFSIFCTILLMEDDSLTYYTLHLILYLKDVINITDQITNSELYDIVSDNKNEMNDTNSPECNDIIQRFLDWYESIMNYE